MQKRMSFVGWFTLLPVALLTSALRSGAVTPGFSMIAETQPGQFEAHSGAGTCTLALPRCIGWNRECSSVGTTQLLAQNRQPPAAAPDQPQASGEEKLDLSDQVIRDVFAPLQRGIEGHNLAQVLAIFDQQEMPDYAQVRDQLQAFFYHYDAVRFRYQLLQVTSDKDHSSAVAEIEMDAMPADPSRVTLRRDIQMRFHLNLGHKGWRLVGFAPADFFSQ